MPKKEQITLSEKYYLDYFLYLLEFVQKHYDHILDTPEELFYADFNRLSEDAKCLYIRLSNRRGDFFQASKLGYTEIQNLDQAIEELSFHQFVGVNESDDPSQLSIFTRDELLSHFEFLSPEQKKPEMLQELTEDDVETVRRTERIIELKRQGVVAFLKLLFFGNRHQKMTEFVIRDIGNVKLQRLDESKFKPWFQKREDALGVMHISQLKSVVRELIKAELPLTELLNEMPWTEWLSYPRSKESAYRLLLKVGAYFEKIQALEEALKYYEYVPRHPARERRIRIHERLGDSKSALQIANELIESPSGAAELTFATDYLNKSGLRINRSMTKRLQQAQVIEIKKTNQRVEAEVLRYFEEKCWEGIHSENFLWRGLFGLTFWEELYNQEYGAFHHPLQRQPSDLSDRNFYLQREEILNAKLDALNTSKAYLKHIKLIHEKNLGNANRFVYWHEELMNYLHKMIKHLPLKGLKKVMLEIAKQTKENSTGFPDLFIWNEDDYHFYEVKSPNDHLSAQQLFWINFLAEAGIKAEIIKVSYVS